MADSVVIGSFDAVGVVAGAFDHAGVGPVPPWWVEVALGSDAGHDGCVRVVLEVRGGMPPGRWPGG